MPLWRLKGLYYHEMIDLVESASAKSTASLAAALPPCSAALQFCLRSHLRRSNLMYAPVLQGNLGDLESDLRRMMLPNTASALRESKRNTLKDFLSVAGPLGVSHFLILTATDKASYLRVAKTPRVSQLCPSSHSCCSQCCAAALLLDETGQLAYTVPLPCCY